MHIRKFSYFLSGSILIQSGLLNDFSGQRFICLQVLHFKDFGEPSLPQHFALTVTFDGYFTIYFGNLFFYYNNLI